MSRPKTRTLANGARMRHPAPKAKRWYITKVAVGRRSRPEAVKLLRECVRIGKVILGRHFRDELANEGLFFSDALRVLKTGQIYDEPEPDPKTGDWKYRVEGREVDGKWLAIVFCFKAVDTAFLITVFSVKTRG